MRLMDNVKKFLQETEMIMFIRKIYQPKLDELQEENLANRN